MIVNEESVFAEALEKSDPQERAAFLDRACAGDAALRKSVESLLSAYDAGQFLEATAPGLDATLNAPPVAEGPGTMVGAYKLLEQIGEGGMGRVFVAEQQQPVRRKVALKVIKPGMDTKQVIARFEAERQALAMMDHPNIAKVHDGGATPEGRPYFVMELVKGTPVTEYCDRQRLSTRARLELFMDVCHAVQHAHQKGIIHRDLKPSNILVSHHDVQAVVKVIDFGVAKATGARLTDRTMYTGFAQMIGTPLYMSPEQAGLSDLDVDTRSDIYSLGVLLYELLTGTTPFDEQRLRTAGFDEMRRIIREEEPPRPSTRVSTLAQAATTVSEKRKADPRQLSRLLRGELDWVVMKALDKDRNRRYESASAFAADVQRYLSDEPVQACPPSMAYRLSKLLRRHRGAALGAGAAVIALVVTVPLTLIVAARERELDQRRLLAQDGINGALAEVARLRGQVRAVDLGDDVARDRMHDQVQRALALTKSSPADPQVSAQVQKLADELDQEQRDRRFLVNLERVWLTPLTPNRDVVPFLTENKRRSLLAEALETYGIQTGVQGKGNPQLVKEVASLINGRPKVVRDALLEALHEYLALANCNCALIRAEGEDGTTIELGRGPEAQAEVARTVAHDVLRDLTNTGTSERVLRVVRPNAEGPSSYRVLFGLTDAWVIDVLESVDPDGWRGRLRRSWLMSNPAERRATWEGLAKDAGARHQPARLLTRLASVLPSTEAALHLLQETQRHNPNDVEANAYLADRLMESNPRQVAEAVRFYTAAVALKPGSSKRHIDLGLVLRKLNRPGDADAEFQESVLVAKDKAAAHFDLGGAFLSAGLLDRAVAELREAARLEPRNAAVRNNLGFALHQAGRLPEASDEYREALLLNPHRAQTHNNLGRLLYAQGNIKEAIFEFTEALQIDVAYEEARQNLALAALVRPGEANAARGMAAEVAAGLVFNFANSKGSPQLDLRQNTVAEFVEAFVRRCLRSMERPNPLAPEFVTQYRKEFWEVWLRQRERLNNLRPAGNHAEALLQRERLNNLRPTGISAEALFLATAYWHVGEQDKARRWYAQAVAAMEARPTNSETKRLREEVAKLMGLPEPVAPNQKRATDVPTPATSPALPAVDRPRP